MVARKLATPLLIAASQISSKFLTEEPLDFKEDIMQLEKLQADRQGLFA